MCERAVLTNRPSLDLSPIVLEGRKSPYRDVAMLNAAAALVVAARAKTLGDGMKLAQHAIDSGEAEGSLGRLIAVSNG